jgi:type I restriction enzyme R subunit
MKTHGESTYESYLASTLAGHGWAMRMCADTAWDSERAWFPGEILAFIQATQGDLWKQMAGQHGPALGGMLLSTLAKDLDQVGLLEVLRHGFKFYGKRFHIAAFKPAHGLNPETLSRYGKNALAVTRQVPCHLDEQGRERRPLDLVLSLNGLPFATVELKNPFTGQTVRDAIRQYQRDRDPRDLIFQFKKRALVHFAVDPDEVWMTTRIQGSHTRFLPFNRGSHPGTVGCGAGNPLHPSGHRTAYLWDEVLQRDSVLDILNCFCFIEKKERFIDDGTGGRKKLVTENLVFPRYHQLDAVRRLTGATVAEGVGQGYLIQHSAGSGKTNSIAWLAHRLSNLHDQQDRKLVHSVIVVTDRTILDTQLQEAIYQIDHAHGVVQPIDEDSDQLAQALIDGTQIIITTLQKFPFVTEKVGALPDRRYAVIIDEAHSSQSGESARQMKETLGLEERRAAEAKATYDVQVDPDEPTYEDRIHEVMESRGRQPNISFFAFTATPKGKTLQMFGRKGADGNYVAPYLYTMRQAIEEEFILDVLSNYTTYQRFFKLGSIAQADKLVDKQKANSALVQYMNLHPHNLDQKTAVMIEHFRACVRQRINGRAKAMVVTGSRLQAVRYMKSFRSYIASRGYTDVRCLVAFSGTVIDPEDKQEYTEPGMNLDVITGKPISEKGLRDRFASDDYQVLLVANKYQTGFDQPLLCAMYVDRPLTGVQAVQTLSRLNRTCPGKKEVLVLDFVNKTDDIKKAFQPFYEQTVLSEEADPQQLYTLSRDLDAAGILHAPQIDAFAAVFYKPREQQNPADHARMNQILDPAVERFKAMPTPEEREDYRTKLNRFIRLYAFLAQIIPFTDVDLEKLYAASRFLLSKLPPPDRGPAIHLGDEVELRYYRLQKAGEGSIALDKSVVGEVKGPTDVGTGMATSEQVKLSTIIDKLNERFGTNFTERDKLFFDQVQAEAEADPEVVQTALANPFENFLLDLRKRMEGIMVDRMAQNDEIVAKYLDDKSFQEVAFLSMATEIFKNIRAQGRTG